MQVCPKCGNDEEVWIKTIAQVAFSIGDQNPPSTPRFHRGKIEAWCAGRCDQRFWWYWKTGRITRRNTGTVDW